MTPYYHHILTIFVCSSYITDSSIFNMGNHFSVNQIKSMGFLIFIWETETRKHNEKQNSNLSSTN
jgi:hypothetical protein